MSRGLVNPGPLERFDERDSVFSRARLRPGTSQFDEYYAWRPENWEADLRTAKLPHLAMPGSHRYGVEEAVLIQSQFAASDLIAAAVEGSESVEESSIPEGLGHGDPSQTMHLFEDPSPARLSAFAKRAARFLGADDVGLTRLDPAHVYSNRGRPSEKWGEPVDLDHPFAVVLVFAMRKECIDSAPEMISTAEVARVYQEAAAACFALADSFRRMGIRARAHVDSNYLLVAPPLAVDAGLGELGRMGLLIHPRLGPGVRLGVVTVDAELLADEPGDWGIADFCRSCEKCAKLCPAGAIPCGTTSIVRGAEKWPISPERCYHYWRTQGSDCGTCLRVCPFTKPDSPLHRFVRKTVARTSRFNSVFLKMDDLFYGRPREPKNALDLKSFGE